MTSDAADAVFGVAVEVEARLLIIDTQAQIVYATPDALELFGAKDRSDLQARLLSGEGPTARRLRHLTASLPIGERPRLERVRFFPQGRAASFNLRCARVGAPDGAAYLVLWAPGAGAGRGQIRPGIGEGADAGSAEAIGFDAPAPSIKPSTKSRFLWSLDKEGRFGPAGPCPHRGARRERACRWRNARRVAAAVGFGARRRLDPGLRQARDIRRRPRRLAVGQRKYQTSNEAFGGAGVRTWTRLRRVSRIRAP